MSFMFYVLWFQVSKLYTQPNTQLNTLRVSNLRLDEGGKRKATGGEGGDNWILMINYAICNSGLLDGSTVEKTLPGSIVC